jgi:hypothetical protein
MLPHVTANEITLATSVLSFATALVGFLALLKKNPNQRTLLKKTFSSGK